ncbi:hypothetical protein HBH26_13165 [Sphingomonas sp. 36D10-4-7]|uniref:Parvulin-like PPIase n=2 Tax=Sphingomonas corticis TaxID=2722791 RepID=A0ABX1CNP8_9SPHN|nr:hypothetical protein [Sphingomonas corticis]
MKSMFMKMFLAGVLCCLMGASGMAVGQERASSEPLPVETADVARLVRAKVPWTWLLKDPDAGTAVVTADQLSQARAIRRIAKLARSRSLDDDVRYTRLRNALDDAALAELARLDLERQITISDTAREAYLASHPGRYDQYRLRHIYIATNGARDGSNRSDGQARTIAEEIKARLASGEQFEALASQYSDDTATAAQGGELSVLLGAYMARPFLDAVRGRKEGFVTSPVRGDEGYHLIRIDQHIPATATSASYQIDQDIIAERLPSLIDAALAQAARPDVANR